MRTVRHVERLKQLRYLLHVIPLGEDTYTVPVGTEPVTIGRAPEAKIYIDEEAVSRRHCLIISTPGRLMLLDQGSTNGTKVNGVRVRQARLKHADVVQVGKVQIRVRAETVNPAAVPHEPPLLTRILPFTGPVGFSSGPER